MDPISRLFAFSGRVTRRGYWLVLVTVMALVLATALAFAALATAVPTPGLLSGTSAAAGLGLVAVMWIALATTVKRLHDRDRSGWWWLVFLFAPSLLQGLGRAYARHDPTGAVSAALSLAGTAVTIWALIELGFLRGTVGDNRFGPDPLAGGRPVDPAMAPPSHRPPPPDRPLPPLRPTPPFAPDAAPEPEEPRRGHRMPLPGGRPPPEVSDGPTSPDPQPPPPTRPRPRYDPWRR